MKVFIKKCNSVTNASLNLRLTGFTKQTIHPIETIVSAIDVIPGFHLQGLREISYLNIFEMNQLQAEIRQGFSNQRKGLFIQNERCIVLSGLDDVPLFDFLHVLYHEIAHYVYFLIISSSLKTYWVTEIYPHAPCLTQYGQQNAAEDFAESYANYLLQPELLKTIPAKYAFFDHLVFSGESVTLKEKF